MTKRTFIIGLLLNTPPLLALLMSFFEVDSFLVIFAALLWANIPLQYLGMSSLFEPGQLAFSEFGVSPADPVVWGAVVVFWLVLATLISACSLLRLSRAAR